MTPTPQPIVLVLAAGAARRFGRDKRLEAFGEGRSVLGEVCHRIVLAGLVPVPVLRSDDGIPLTALTEQHLRVPASIAAQGMGATLAAAAVQLPDGRDCLVCLGDMPWIAPQTYRCIAALLTRPAGVPRREALSQRTDATIVQPVYRGQRGHPVGFAARYRDELAGLSGDTGARPLLQRHRQHLRMVEVDDPGILRDVDSPQDLLPA